MMKNEMSNEEKKRLSYERQNAVRKAWKDEKSRVSDGYGTRKWSAEEQEELICRGAVRGYEGHHMKSVSLYPEYAGDSNNIQFLSEEEHLYGAHNGSYHNLTNGYYDPETQTMNEFGDDLGELPVYDLTTYERVENIVDIKSDYYKDVERQTMPPSANDIQEVKKNLNSSEIDNSDKNEIGAGEEKGFSNGRR